MDNNIKNIVINYLCLKKECMDRKFENLNDVIRLFNNEVFELAIVNDSLSKTLSEFKHSNLSENHFCRDIIDFYEEHLLNEIADVILTGSRLISEFGLEEALNEMLEYKYERQVGRELKRFKK